MKKCIWCDTVLQEDESDHISYCICDECAKKVRRILNIDGDASDKEKALEILNKVRVFVLEAAKDLKNLGLKQETISKVLLLEEVGFKRLKQCPECGTMNMVFAGKKEFQTEQKGKTVFHWYECTNCGHAGVEEV